MKVTNFNITGIEIKEPHQNISASRSEKKLMQIVITIQEGRVEHICSLCKHDVPLCQFDLNKHLCWACANATDVLEGG